MGRFRFTQYESVTQSVTQSRDIAQRVFPVTSADFDQNYQPINDTYPGISAGSYVTQAGDNLQSVALAMWGDSSLWYLLADANGLRGTEQIPAGTRLTVPNVVTNVHNSSPDLPALRPRARARRHHADPARSAAARARGRSAAAWA